MLPVYHAREARRTIIGGIEEVMPLRDQRRHERYFLQFPVTLVFENGLTFNGLSQNVSLSGFFVNLQPGHVLENELRGMGTILLGQEKVTFPCRLTRQTRAGIAIAILKDSARLGYAITTHIFNEISAHPFS